MYDVIGDIHGYYDALHSLLTKLDYVYDSRWHVFRHPRGRQAVFVGDFIDRGPKNVHTVRLVRNMVDQGYAKAIMANHDMNAVLWTMKNPNKEGEFLRPHNNKNQIQHKTYLDEVGNNPSLLNEMTTWLKSLPLYLRLGNACIVHACWHQNSIDQLHSNNCLDDNHRLTDKGWHAAGDKSSEFHKAIELLLKGPKEDLPSGESFFDQQGVERMRSRVAWWNPNPVLNADAYASLPEGQFASEAFNQANRSDLTKSIHYGLMSMPQDQKIFIGHIWLTGVPQPLSDRVISVDYSIAKGDKLVAFRMVDPQTPHQGHFVSVPANAQKREIKRALVK